MILDVIDGGLLTTVQDAGRPDAAHLGVPESGAADRRSLAVANLLVGNEPDAAALEITIAGPTLVAHGDGPIALAGAELGARVVGGRRLAVGRSHWLAAGEQVAFDGGAVGARTYLAVPGGVDVPVVLDSRSTCLAGAFGGLAGRPILAGDRIVSAIQDERECRELVWPDLDEPIVEPSGRAGDEPVVLRVLPGLDPGLDSLAAAAWRVGSAADRVGVRLDGEPLPDGIGGETLTHGVPWGAIQVPPDGRPIALGVDHQTTGGYRVVAVVIAADRPTLGQLRPGDPVRFVATDAATAVAALRAQRDVLASGARALREAAGWERLAASAGG